MSSSFHGTVNWKTRTGDTSLVVQKTGCGHWFLGYNARRFHCRLGSQKVNKLKLFLLGLVGGSVILSSLSLSANPQEDAIAERIKKVGTVCIEGADCGQASTSVAMAANDSGGAEANYNKTCATCHNAGVAGAPKLGDAAAWAPRLEKGIDALYASAINGLPPAMPAKGMCFGCSDDDLKAIVDHMVESVE